MNNTSSTIIADTGLTTEEITTASRRLSVTRGFLLESVGSLSTAQWNFKPAGDAWSAAENMEHIVLIESGIHAIIEGMNDVSGQTAEGDRREMDEFILNQIPKRSRKGKGFRASLPDRPLEWPRSLAAVRAVQGAKHSIAGHTPASGSCFPPSSLWSMGWLPMAVGSRIPWSQAHGTDPRSESRQEFSSSLRTTLRGRHALHDVDLLPGR